MDVLLVCGWMMDEYFTPNSEWRTKSVRHIYYQIQGISLYFTFC